MESDKIKGAIETLAEKAKTEHSADEALSFAKAASQLAQAYATIKAVESQFGK